MTGSTRQHGLARQPRIAPQARSGVRWPSSRHPSARLCVSWRPCGVICARGHHEHGGGVGPFRLEPPRSPRSGRHGVAQRCAGAGAAAAGKPSCGAAADADALWCHGFVHLPQRCGTQPARRACRLRAEWGERRRDGCHVMGAGVAGDTGDADNSDQRPGARQHRGAARRRCAAAVPARHRAARCGGARRPGQGRATRCRGLGPSGYTCAASGTS